MQNITLATNSTQPMSKIQTSTIKFQGQNTTLTAHIYQPSQTATNHQNAILISPCMGASIAQYCTEFASFFAQHGYLVMTYNHFGFGDNNPNSITAPIICPTTQTQDLLHAYYHLINHMQIKPSNISLWGNSLSAANSFLASTKINHKLKCLIMQVPFLCGQTSLAAKLTNKQQDTLAKLQNNPKILARLVTLIAAKNLANKSQPIINTPDALEFYWLDQHWQARTSMQSVLNLMQFSLCPQQTPNTARIIIINSKDDAITSHAQLQNWHTALTSHNADLNPQITNITYAGGHFAPLMPVNRKLIWQAMLEKISAPTN